MTIIDSKDLTPDKINHAISLLWQCVGRQLFDLSSISVNNACPCLQWMLFVLVCSEQNLSVGTEMSRKWHLTGGVPDISCQMPCWVQGLGLSKAELGERFAQICVSLLMGGWHWVHWSCCYILSSGWQWQPLLQEQRAEQHTAGFHFFKLYRSGPSRSLLEVSIWGVINKTSELRSVLWRW